MKNLFSAIVGILWGAWFGHLFLMKEMLVPGAGESPFVLIYFIIPFIIVFALIVYIFGKFFDTKIIPVLLFIIPFVIYIFVPSLSGIKFANDRYFRDALRSKSNSYCLKIKLDPLLKGNCTEQVNELSKDLISITEPNTLRRR